MKDALLISVAVFALILSASAQSAGQFVTISNFKLWATTYGNNQIRITSVTIINPGSCADPDSYVVKSSLTLEEKNRIYGMLLAAVTAKKSVEIWVDGCEGTKPTFHDVLMQ